MPRKTYKKKSKSPKSPSRESKSPEIRRRRHLKEDLNINSPDRRHRYEDKEDLKLTLSEREHRHQNQEKSKSPTYLEIKSKQRYQRSPDLSSDESESSDLSASSDLESPGSPSPRESSSRATPSLERKESKKNAELPARIKKNKNDDYAIGFEKLSEDARRVKDETSESPSIRKKRDKEKKKVDRKARSSAKISEADIATVSQLLSEHGFQAHSKVDSQLLYLLR